MVQGSSGGNTVYTGGKVPGHSHGINKEHKGSGSQGGVENILTQAAAQKLHKNDGKHAANSRQPIRHGMGQRHRKQHAGDQRRAIDDGIAALGNKAIQPFRANSAEDAHRSNRQSANAQHENAYDQGGHQCQHHVQHDAAGAKIPSDVGRRSNC